MSYYEAIRKKIQAKRGREVYIIEVDGLPETRRRHAYRTRGLAQSAALCIQHDGKARVVRYVPAPEGEP